MKIPPARSERVFDPSSLHRILFTHYGPSGWWPGETPFEVMVGAVLTQNTAWTNVEKAIANLKKASLMDVWSIDLARPEDLAVHLRPSGYFNIKAQRLKNLVHMIASRFAGDLGMLFSLDTHTMRSALLSVNGIGMETADSICCYAAEKTIFVVDAYTRRILSRHGIISERADYDHIRALFEAGLPQDLAVYRDLHAHLVFIGKDYCRPRTPACDSCPLNKRL